MTRARLGTPVQFGLLALAWGSSFLFIKIALTELSPAQIVAGRLLLGALTLGVLVLATRQSIPRELRLWAHLAVVSVLLCVLPFLLFAWAETRLSSGLASIYNATTPLATTAFAAALLRTERLTRNRLTGLLLGFAGVLVIIGPFTADLTGDLPAQLACLGATTSYGLAFVYLRRFLGDRDVPAVTMAFIQVTIGAVLMLLTTPFLGTPGNLSPPVLLSMIALGAVGTGLAYVWNTAVVRDWGATNAAAVTYVTPVVGVLLGVLVLAEPVAWHQPVGAALVLLGILAAHGRLSRRRPIPADADPPGDPVNEVRR
ncbi:DMT family transporter [Crossiella cryophila]|uniref:DMT family transporter n=1 Tax=Crossiella cryophila TaxID=43355 RepID=UPI003899269B